LIIAQLLIPLIKTKSFLDIPLPIIGYMNIFSGRPSYIRVNHLPVATAIRGGMRLSNIIPTVKRNLSNVHALELR
jgi:hypothetical protein